MPKNVAILLTPPGGAAIACVRIRGPAVGDFLSAHFTRAVLPGRAVHGELIDGPRVIDDIVVVRADSHTADLNLHGGAWVVRSALELAQRGGFGLPGSSSMPLSPAAVDADSLLDFEVLTHLPFARTELGVRVLLVQSALWRGLQARAADEQGPGFQGELEQILVDRSLHHLLNPPTVAIVGVANAGKSTLANQLYAQERSITADLPGTTRDWVGGMAQINGLPVMLVDTPGLRTTSDPIEQTAIDKSRGEIARADQVILVLDASRSIEGEQASLLARYPSAIHVLNKSDRRLGWDPPSPDSIHIVATTGEGIDLLRTAIVDAFCGEPTVALYRPRCWTERQRKIVSRAITTPAELREL